MTASAANAQTLNQEIAWCSQVLDTRFQHYFAGAEATAAPFDARQLPPPDLTDDPSPYARIVQEEAMGFDERMVLILALLPHIRPQVLDVFFSQSPTLGRACTEFGGWRGKVHAGFLPTCETAAFILAGADLARRFEILPLFEPEHVLSRRGILKIEHGGGGEPFFSAALNISTEYLNRFTSGHNHKPDYSAEFPAKLITTRLGWQDLVLAPDVMEEIDCLTTWLAQSQAIINTWSLANTVKPGYRSLFYGPPGTGKTLTATLIGANAGVDVYRIDLSMVVSKYIGETEKNLATVFDQAQNKNWILFFDEADALFGKRTQTSSSNDRHANQEVSYLLQRVEDFPGMVILASNLKGNIDEAFSRRFQSTVYFPLPDATQRKRLWQGMFPDPSRLAASVDLAELAEKYELSGGALTNVVRYAAIRATRLRRTVIEHADLVKGIGKELLKEGRTL